MQSENILNRLLWQLAKIGRFRFWYLASHKDFHIISAIYVFTAVSISMAILGIAAYITSWPMIFPSLGPTIFLMFYAPSSPLAAPRNAVFGHIGACLIGMAGHWTIVTMAQDGLVTGPIEPHSLAVILESSIFVGITSVYMTITGFIHPPAASSSLIAALGLMPDWHNIPVLIAALGLISIQAWIMHKINGVRFPIWSPFKEVKGLKVETKLGDLTYQHEDRKNKIERLAKALATRQKIKD